jgi:hypothetical protein
MLQAPIKVLRLGAENPPAAVQKLHRWLAFLGYDIAGGRGEFIAATQAAVVAFQTAHGLTGDGIFGARSFVAMRNAVIAKTQGLLQSFLDNEHGAKAQGDMLISCPADYLSKGARNFVFRTDVAYWYMQLYTEAKALGVMLPSAGGLRAINAKVTAGRIATSMHYVGAAFDIHTGAAMGKPESDPFIVEHIGDRRWRVWARTQNESVPVRTIENPYTYTKRAGTGVPVTGRFVDFTALAAKYHFGSIRGREAFFDLRRKDGDVRMLAEWWHFQNDFVLLEGFATMGSELRVMYSQERIDAAPKQLRASLGVTYRVNWN